MKKEDKIYLIKKTFKTMFVISFIIYMSLFIMNNTGYYNFSLKKQKELTEEQIKKFENDVKNGVDIDIESYLEVKNVSYQNNTSKLGLTISSGIENIVKNSIYKILDLIGGLVEENK